MKYLALAFLFLATPAFAAECVKPLPGSYNELSNTYYYNQCVKDIPKPECEARSTASTTYTWDSDLNPSCRAACSDTYYQGADGTCYPKKVYAEVPTHAVETYAASSSPAVALPKVSHLALPEKPTLVSPVKKVETHPVAVLYQSSSTVPLHPIHQKTSWIEDMVAFINKLLTF